MLNRFLLFILFCSPVFTFAQSTNGGFEQGFSDGTTLGWSTPDIAGANVTNDALSGSRAAKAWVFSYYKLGSWVSLASVDDFIPNAGGAPVLPTKLTGYYKYLGESAECDMADISLLIGMRNDMGKVDTLALGATELKLSNRYRYFEFPVNGDPVNASFVSVNFSPAGRCNNHGGSNCCFLYVDDLKMLPDPNADAEKEVEEVPKTVLVPVKTVKPHGKVLGRKARGRKARKERRQRMKQGYQPAAKRTPAPQRPPEMEKTKPAPKAETEATEEKIPAEIQKEIDRIRKVQAEEAEKRMNSESVEEAVEAEEAVEEEAAETEEEVEDAVEEEDDFFTPNEEEATDELPIEKGWETEESSDEE